MCEDSDQGEANNQPVDADAPNCLPPGSGFSLGCKERDNPKNKSTDDEQRADDSEAKHSKRVPSDRSVAEHIHCNGKAGCRLNKAAWVLN